jgi:hypothetical protein
MTVVKVEIKVNSFNMGSQRKSPSGVDGTTYFQMGPWQVLFTSPAPSLDTAGNSTQGISRPALRCQLGIEPKLLGMAVQSADQCTTDIKLMFLVILIYISILF